MKERIFLDSISATKPAAAALRCMFPYLEDYYGQILSPHQMGQELTFEVEKSLRSIFSGFSAHEDDRFVFTSSGVEAINQVIYTIYKEVVRTTGKNQFVMTQCANAAQVLSVSKLEDEGCSLHFAKTQKNGIVSVDQIVDAISPRTALISLSIASPLTGVIQPISEIQKLCELRKILLHVDVTHAIGKIPLDFHEMGIDYMTFHGEQFHAPKGIGGLFVKKGAPLVPLISGEGEDDFFRGGPFNVALLVACKQAVQEAEENRNLYCTEVARLRDLLETEVQRGYPEALIPFQEDRLPHISCICFPGIQNEFFLYNLNKKGVFASMGGGAFQAIDRVLNSASVDPKISKTALAFSLSKDTTEQEIQRASQIIVENAKRLRKLSQKL